MSWLLVLLNARGSKTRRIKSPLNPAVADVENGRRITAEPVDASGDVARLKIATFVCYV